MSSPKQIKQQKIRQALGTVIGFHGYLSNLETVLQRTEMYNRGSHHLINALHEKLRGYESDLREEMKNL